MLGRYIVVPQGQVCALGAVPCPFALNVTVQLDGGGGVFAVHTA